MKKSPPIKIWIWVGLFFIGLQIIIVNSYPFLLQKSSEINNYVIVNTQLNTISKKIKKNPDLYNVIIIGSSLIKNGIKEGIYSDSLQLSKIYAFGDYIYPFINTHHLVDSLIKLKPNLVCIQIELAAITFSKNSNPRFLKELSLKSIYFFNHVFASGHNKPINIKNIKYDTINHIPIKRWVKKHTNLGFLLIALDKLKKAGIETKIIDVPKPFKSEQKVYTKEFKYDLKNILKIYEEKLKIEHLKYSGKTMYYKHFIDGGHLNESGKKIYTEWLVNTLLTHKKN
jgi:hypothetical protein